jgi:hypothetical protein
MGAFSSRDFHDCGTMSSYDCKSCPILGPGKQTLLDFFVTVYGIKPRHMFHGDDLVVAPRATKTFFDNQTCGDIHTCTCVEPLMSNSVMSKRHSISDLLFLEQCMALSTRIFKADKSLLVFGEDRRSFENAPFSMIDHSDLKSLTSKIFLCRTLDRTNLPRSFYTFRVYKSMASPTIYELHSSECYLHSREDDDAFISVEDALNFLFYLEISHDAYKHSKGIVQVGVGSFPSRNNILIQDSTFCSILRM